MPWRFILSDKQIDIVPALTVHKLLLAYPELEDVLIAMAPPFRKLRNPVLRRSVAKIATLRQAAAVAGISLDDMIDKLRQVVGQAGRTESYANEEYFSAQPDWFAPAKIALTVDEQQTNGNEMTLGSILRGARGLNPGDIIELKTSFLPAPGIDVMRAKGYSVWVRKESEKLLKTYFLKP